MASAPADINVRSYIGQIPFACLLGFELAVFEGGEAEIRYTAGPDHLNSFDVTHGGACMTLLDVAMSAAARSQVPEIGAVTIEMKTSFMRPSVGPLLARARLTHRTATLGFVEGTIYDEQQRACAHATGTYKYVKRRLPIGPASANALRPPSTD